MRAVVRHCPGEFHQICGRYGCLAALGAESRLPACSYSRPQFAVSWAFAQSSAENGYSQPAGSVQQQVGPSGSEDHSAKSSEGGQLPFTGLDIALVAAAGGVLLAIGFGIRRLSRSELA